MQADYQISKSEREIMEVLWKCHSFIRTKELLDIMNSRGKEWKRQTLNTLLYRLENKKVVTRKHAYVEAAISEMELLQRQTQQMLDTLYDGEYTNFIAALTKNTQIDSEIKSTLDDLIWHLRESA